MATEQANAIPAAAAVECVALAQELRHSSGCVLFLDPQRGYAVGWGPHVWRTADGGQSWREVKVQPLADAGRPRKTFDAVNLGPDGVLRVAYYVEQLGDLKTSSLVYRMAWNHPDFEQDVALPNQTVVDLQSSPDTTGGYSLYALSRLGAPRNLDDPNDNGHRTGALSVWTIRSANHCATVAHV